MVGGEDATRCDEMLSLISSSGVNQLQTMGPAPSMMVRIALKQGWGACGPREHLKWPSSEFLLSKKEHSIASKMKFNDK